MFYDGALGMGGMHAVGWIFWLAVVGVLLYLAFGRAGRQRRETPLEVLQRRLAAGEITTEDYERRKALLDRDAAGSKG